MARSNNRSQVFYVQTRVNYQDCLRDLRGVARDQLPFAYASALTETAFKGRMAVQSRMRDVFELHTDYLIRGILVEKAKKADFQRYGTAEAAVFTGDKATPYLALHETGGEKKPVQGRRAISIPGKNLPDKAVSATGAIKPKWKPRALLSQAEAQKGGKGKKRGARTPKPFKLNGSIVVRRGTHRRSHLETLYHFKRTAEIKPTFKMEETVRNVVEKTFERTFGYELERAIQTART